MTNCHRLKLEAVDGIKYLTDVARSETLLRLARSVPSDKSEPIKLWHVKIGYERMQDMADPVRSLDRARKYWQECSGTEQHEFLGLWEKMRPEAIILFSHHNAGLKQLKPSA